MHNLSVCAIFRDEGEYLQEWLDFHLIAGVEHFYLYNHRSPDDYQSVLKPFIQLGVVTLYESSVTGIIAAQCSAYMDCIGRHKNDTKWMGFIDVDEFLYSPQGDLKNVIKNFEGYGALVVNWQCFGSNGQKQKRPGAVIQRFTQKAQQDWDVNKHVKSIVQPRYVDKYKDPHFFTYTDGRYAVNENRIKVNGPFSLPVSISHIRINHYRCKSESEGRARWQLSQDDKMNSKFDWQAWINHDHNEVEDYGAMMQFLPRMEPGFENWLGQFKGQPVSGMEVGVWKGDCSIWLLENVLTHPTSKLYAVDTFEGGEDHKAAGMDFSGVKQEYLRRIEAYKNKVIVLEGYSHSELRAYDNEPLDFIYIDASHTAADVLADSVLAWPILKPGGVLIWDDYEWKFKGPLHEPKLGINSFLSCYEGKYKIIHKGYRIVVEKI